METFGNSQQPRELKLGQLQGLPQARGCLRFSGIGRQGTGKEDGCHKKHRADTGAPKTGEEGPNTKLNVNIL